MRIRVCVCAQLRKHTRQRSAAQRKRGTQKQRDFERVRAKYLLDLVGLQQMSGGH